MRPLNLFILTFRLQSLKRIENIQVVPWTILFLIVADILVNLLFPYPYNSQKFPNFLQQYFEYGRSAEGKIRRLVGESDEQSALITKPGWLDSGLFETLPSAPDRDDKLLIATYGGSFNQRISRIIESKYENYTTVRAVGAPLGPLNWTYSAYQLDRGQHQADAAVLTLISFTAAQNTMGGLFDDLPAPYTRPMYFLENDRLERVDPVIQTLPQLKQAVRGDDELWNRHVEKIQQFDPYYNPLLFQESLFDASTISRLVRRFYGKQFADQYRSNFYTEEGFDSNSEEVKVMQLMVEKFARTARADGVVPIVYLANTQGWSQHLYEALEPTLSKNSIPYVSSHTFVPTDDPRLFLDDGHYIDEKDEEIADEIFRLIQSNLQSANAGS